MAREKHGVSPGTLCLLSSLEPLGAAENKYVSESLDSQGNHSPRTRHSPWGCPPNPQSGGDLGDPVTPNRQSCFYHGFTPLGPQRRE